MKTIIKTFGLLLGFFLLLSITVKGKPLFTHLYGFISPVANYAQSGIENFFSRSLSSTQTYSKKLFDNSVPRMNDSVKSKLSGSKKIGAPQEDVSSDDQRQLDQLIKNH
jgi:hypothetical protein